MALSALDRYTFDVRGFLVFEDALDPGTVAAARRAIAEQGLSAPGPTVNEQRFNGGDMLRWHPVFRDLIDHPLAVDVLKDLIGPYARLDHAYGIMMRAGTSGFGLHGPNPPFDAAEFYLHRGGRMWNGLLAFSWALTTAAPGEGGFGCIPGSHRAEEPFPPGGAEVLAVEIPQRAGSLVVFTEALAHCTMPWRRAEDRLSLLYKYSPGNSTWAAQAAVPADVLPLLSPRQRLLVEPPYVGGRRPALEI